MIFGLILFLILPILLTSFVIGTQNVMISHFFSCTIQFPFKHFWSIEKNHKDFFTCPINYITCAVNSTSRFTCIMKMLSNFIVFVISVFIFRSFLSKYDKFVDYMIYAPFLLMVSFSFFKINFIHCVFFYGFTKYFHAIFTSV